MYINSGSTLLNCAFTDNPFNAYKLGTINTIKGSSQSGKTFITLTSMAEMIYDDKYKDYEFIYDDGEESLGFNLEYLFGKKVAGKIKYPNYNEDGTPLNSETIEEFKSNILKRIKSDKPFFYVLDSLDSLSSSAELDREYSNALKVASKIGDPEFVKDLKTGFKTEKAKQIGETLRIINNKIKHTESILIIIQQMRDNVNRGYGEETEITSGGRAPYFYSYHQIKLKRASQILASTTNKRIIGYNIRVKVSKNKETGKIREINFPLYYDYGIDDIISQIDFLVEEKMINKKKDKDGKEMAKTFDFKELGIEGSKDTLVKLIEEKKLQNKLSNFTGKCWNKIEDSIKLNDRTRRYK